MIHILSIACIAVGAFIFIDIARRGNYLVAFFATLPCIIVGIAYLVCILQGAAA